MMSNETGIFIGRLSPTFLRDLVLNYKGENQETLKLLMEWYDEAVKLSSVDDDVAKIGLALSIPLIQIGRRS